MHRPPPPTQPRGGKEPDTGGGGAWGGTCACVGAPAPRWRACTGAPCAWGRRGRLEARHGGPLAGGGSRGAQGASGPAAAGGGVAGWQRARAQYKRRATGRRQGVAAEGWGFGRSRAHTMPAQGLWLAGPGPARGGGTSAGAVAPPMPPIAAKSRVWRPPAAAARRRSRRVAVGGEADGRRAGLPHGERELRVQRQRLAAAGPRVALARGGGC
jgi:hypothetical protein